MMLLPLAEVVLTGSAIKATRMLYKALREKRSSTADHHGSFRSRASAAIESLSPQDRETLLRLLGISQADDHAPQGDALAANAALKNPKSLVVEQTAGGIALALTPDQVFQDARRRIDLVFKLNLAIAIVLTLILIIGFGGAVVSAVFLGRDVWAITFGGVAAADVVGLYVLRPLTAINAALVASQRLDTIHLRLREELTMCNAVPDLDQRIACQTKVWNTLQKELASLPS